MSVPSSPIPTPVHTPAWTRFFLNPGDTGSRPGKALPPSSALAEQPNEREDVLNRRFRILSQLGSGGMACVYLCEDLALRSQAAVKVLQSSDPDLRRRFLDEVTILANLRHPHLVQVLAVGEALDGTPYMAMEHLGRSLDQQLRENGPLPWREAREAILQVGSALEALHRAGVIHRDVKPSNIAELRGVTGARRVKLIDLGIARVEEFARVQSGGEPLPPRRRTAAGKIIGTPGYVPPEAGLATPDARFDVYSLGVTLYQLCTGQIPDPAELQTMEDARPGSGIPDGLEAVVCRAMAVLPEDRFSTVAELRRELAAIQSEWAESPAPQHLFDGCYELIELLGVGAKAEVWRAYHRDARCYVAIKILREEVLERADDRARFVREARVLAAIDDPAMPKLIDCRTGPDEPRPFIAMELRRGETIAAIGLETFGPSGVIAVGVQLAAALGTLHQQGVLHRDLNRSNVLIDRRDGEPVVSLIDFGEAELLDRFYALTDERYPTPPEARTRPESEALRLLEWTAPEARAGHGWTPRSDVYSLGRLLYRLLTGKLPTIDDDGRWTSPAELIADCPGPLANALLGAIQVDPELRLSIAEFIDRLNAADEELRESALVEAEMEDEEKRRAAATPSEPPMVETVPPSLLPSSRRRWTLASMAALSLVFLGVWIGQRMGSPQGLHSVRAALAWASVAPERYGDRPHASATLPEETNDSQAATPPRALSEPRKLVGKAPAEVAGAEKSPEPESQPEKARTPSIPPKKARQRELSKKREEIGGCLPSDAGAVIVSVNVDAAGQLARVSHDAPNLPSMVTKCIERQLRHLSLQPGVATQHRLKIGRG